MNKSFLIIIAIGLYLVWISATYLLEGRIELLHHNDPFGRAGFDRGLYRSLDARRAFCRWAR